MAAVFDAAKEAGNWLALQGLHAADHAGVAAVLGALFSLLLAFASINLKADQTDRRHGAEPAGARAGAVLYPHDRATRTPCRWPPATAASWFMLKKSMFGYGRSDEMGFFGDTFVNKVYLATYVCILIFIVTDR